MSSYNIEIQYPGIQGAAGSSTAAGVNTGVQYNGRGALASSTNFTTDGAGNVSITGSGNGNGTLSITVNGEDSGQVTALTLLDNSNGADGVTQIFKTSGSYPNTQVSLNLDSEFGLFSITDDIHAANILSYTNASALTLGNVDTYLFLNGVNTTLVESSTSVTLTLDNQNPNLYVNGQNAAIWAQGQNARLYANDGTGTNFIQAGVYGLVVGLTAFTDEKGRGTVNAESYYVNGVPFAAAAVAVASLPGLLAGSRAFVNDSSVGAAGNFGAIVAGGAANFVPVWCDGTNWRIG